MAKSFKVPFAFTGDKTTVPVALQPDGSVSYTQGFGPDYELDKLIDPINAKDVPRDQTNQLFYDLTDAVGEVQQYGAAIWSADMAPYPINARVAYSGKYWRSNTASNSGEPGVGSGWDDISMPLLDSVRIDVASASTVNLTTAAPNTRHINITGTTAITGFTVAAGLCYFVRFAGTLTLTNSASLVTQTGANITTAAGDTCIIRATSDNVVEVLSYSPAGGWASSFSTAGYQKLPSGLIIQWGTHTFNFAGIGTLNTTITYPIAFPNQVLSSSSQSNVNFVSDLIIVTSLAQDVGNKASAPLYAKSVNSYVGPVPVNWIAIGY